MRILSGVDIVKISRMQASIEQYGEQFLKKIFTEDEIAYCGGRVESLAVRYAAKEAGMKMLGSGIHLMGWHDIEVMSDEKGSPELLFHQNARLNCEEIGLTNWSLSMSHSRTDAVAMVVGLV